MSPVSAADTPDVAAFFRGEISRRTGAAPETIVGDTVLVDIGLQSIDAVMICGEIEDRFGIEVEPALMFRHRTFDEVVGAVDAVLAERRAKASVMTPAKA